MKEGDSDIDGADLTVGGWIGGRFEILTTVARETEKDKYNKMERVVLAFQFIFILVDLVLNTTTPFVRDDKLIVTFLFM